MALASRPGQAAMREGGRFRQDGRQTGPDIVRHSGRHVETEWWVFETLGLGRGSGVFASADKKKTLLGLPLQSLREQFWAGGNQTKRLRGLS